MTPTAAALASSSPLAALAAALLSLLGGVAFAGPGTLSGDGAPTELGAVWSVHTLDAPRPDDQPPPEATPDFDDREWPDFATWTRTEASGAPWARTETWYRATLFRPDERPYAIALHCRNADVALWIDGVRVPGGCGGDAYPPVTPGRSSLVVPMPPGPAGLTHTVAVRTRRSPAMSVNLRRFPHWARLDGVAALTPTATVWASGRDEATAGEAAIRILQGILALGIALFHLVLWLRRPSLSAYAWFGMASLSIGLWEMEAAGARLPPPVAWHAGWTVHNGVFWTWLGILSMHLFMWHYLDGRVPRGLPRWMIGGIVLFAVLHWVPGYFPLHLAIFELELGLAVVALLAGVVGTLKGVYDRKRGALALLLAALPGVTFLGLHATQILPRIHVGPVVIQGASLGFVVALAGVGLVLAIRFTDSMDEVDERVRQLADFNDAIRRFVPTAFLAQLGKRDITEVARGDQVERDMAVLFADIRGFTELTEGMTPAQAFALVNDYLAAMEPPIRHAGGFIDKYIGDAIMALFPGDAAMTPGQQAIDAAVAMHTALEQLNAQRTARGEPPIAIGVGLHKGKLMLGTVGAEDRLEGTVISDAVNLASRVESLTKRYGARVLATSEVLDDLGARRPPTREVDLVAVKGRKAPAHVHEVLTADPDDERNRKWSSTRILEQALSHYRAGRWNEAEALFGQVPGAPSDRVVQLYRERIAFWRRNPPTAWTGVTRMDEK